MNMPPNDGHEVLGYGLVTATATGAYTFSKDDHRGLKKTDAVMLQVKDGKFRLAR